MTYDRQHWHVTFLFVVQGTDEIAATGFDVAAPGPGDAMPDPATISTARTNALGAAMVSLLTNGPIRWAAYSRLVGLRVGHVGTDGKETTYDPLERPLTPVAGNNANPWGPETSVVLSTRSGSRLGRANYGRMYLPHTHLDLDTNLPYASAATTASAADAAQDFAAEVVDFAGADGFPAIMSSIGTGTTKSWVQVGVGRVNDTQRRRRNQLDENTVLRSVL